MNGQLGLGFENNSVSIPKEINLYSATDPKIKKIVCSKAATGILLQNGKIITFGSTREGVLGHHFVSSGKNETLPRLLEDLEDEKIMDLSLGDHHAAAINEKGEVYFWGSYNHGKLGFKKIKKDHRARRTRNSGSGIQKVPRKSEFFGLKEGQINAKKILCTNQNTFIIGILN